jgi:hypothetical protein
LDLGVPASEEHGEADDADDRDADVERTAVTGFVREETDGDGDYRCDRVRRDREQVGGGAGVAQSFDD